MFYVIEYGVEMVCLIDLYVNTSKVLKLFFGGVKILALPIFFITLETLDIEI